MIQPFGIILIIILIKKVFLIKTKRTDEIFSFLFLLLVFLELFVNVGYFAKIGNYEILYDEFILLLITLISIFYALKNTSKIRIKVSLVIFVYVLLITEILLAVNPIKELIYRNELYLKPFFSFYSILVFLKVVVMLFISTISLNLIDRQKILDLFEKLLNLVNIIYVIVIVEWISKNILKSNVFHLVINYIFGRGLYTVDFLLNRGSSYSLQGLSREPAHLTFGLFIFLIILIFSNVKKRKKNIYFVLGIVILTISGSLSGIGYAIALILCYLLNSKEIIKYILYLFGGVVFLISLFPKDLFIYYVSRILNSISLFLIPSENSTYTSEFVRIFSIQESIRTIILKRPLFGAGLGVPYAYSGTIMIISSIGIIGFLTWFYYYFVSIGKVKSLSKKMTILIIFIILTLIGSISLIYSGFMLLLVLQLRFSSISYINDSKKNINSRQVK